MMALVLSLYSCIHDEVYSYAETSSTEYTNKSLWKQDEKYIKNVMKIYRKHESEIKKTAGTPYWDYATTVSNFDERFLMVPVVEGRKVISVIQVPRHGKKVYFYYTNFREHISFFQGLVFAKHKKIEYSQDNVSARETRCVTQWFSVWMPDKESNPDPSSGEGHWESKSVIVCKPLLDQDFCEGIVNEFGQCEGGGNGGNDDGGYDYGGGEPGEEEKTPCEKIQAVGKDDVTKNAMSNLKTKVNDNKEHAYLLWEDSTGQLKDDIYGTGPVNGDGINFNFDSGDKFAAYLHSHYNKPDMLSTFSFKDFISLCALVYFDGIKDVDSFVMGVVTASNTQYMMIIDDPAKLTAFASKFYVNGVYDKNMAKTFQDFYNDSVVSTNSIEKNEGGLVNFLELQNTGLKLMKGDDQMNNWQQLVKTETGAATPVNCN